MNLKAKVYEQERKLANEQKLSARLAILKEKGLDEAAMEKDAGVKKIKADIRTAVRRLKAIAAQEKLRADKKRAREAKLAAEKKSAKVDNAKKPAAKEPKKEKKPRDKKSADSE